MEERLKPVARTSGDAQAQRVGTPVHWHAGRARPPPAPHTRFDQADFQPRLKTRLLVLQATPFCNIRCDYCYLPDRDDTARMSVSVACQSLQRLIDDDLLGTQLTVIWHAGEPLAMPLSFYEEAFEALRRVAGPRCTLIHAMQTNGLLIDAAWCAFFARRRVSVGVSVDGPAFLHDAHRRTRRGHGTHGRVMQGLACLREHGVPFHAIAVVTANTLAHAEAFINFFASLGAEVVGCNFDEAEGAYAASSIAAHEQAHHAFLEQVFDRATASSGGLVVREQVQAQRLLAQALPLVRWQGRASPNNAQLLPFAIVNVAWNGDFGTFSPELLGQPSADFAGFVLGNVGRCGYLESSQGEPFQSLWAAVRRGTDACQRTCTHFDYCGGGAPVNKLYENGRLDSAETLYCRSMIKRPFDVALVQAERHVHT